MSAGRNSFVHQFSNLVECLFFNQRADVNAVLKPVADLERFHPLRHPLGEFVGNRGVHNEAVCRGAGFADVAHLRLHCTFDGLVEVGVFAHDERCVAAELHGGLEHVVGCLLQQVLADIGGSGERNLARNAGFHPRGDHSACRARRDDVDNTCGNTGFDQHFHKHERCQRRQLRGLEHNGAAGCQCGSDLAGAHGQREVPGCDQDARADRLLGDHEAVLAVGGLHVVAADAHGFFGEPAEEFGAVGDFALGFGERFAHFSGHDRTDFVLLLHEQFEGAAQDFSAFARWGGSPRFLCPASCFDGVLGVFFAAVGNFRNDFAGCGVDDVDGVAGFGVAPLPVNEQSGVDLVDDRLHVHA